MYVMVEKEISDGGDGLYSIAVAVYGKERKSSAFMNL